MLHLDCLATLFLKLPHDMPVRDVCSLRVCIVLRVYTSYKCQQELLACRRDLAALGKLAALPNLDAMQDVLAQGDMGKVW